MNVQLTVDLEHQDFTFGSTPDLAPRWERVVTEIREHLLAFDRSGAAMATFQLKAPYSTDDQIGTLTLQV